VSERVSDTRRIWYFRLAFSYQSSDWQVALGSRAVRCVLCFNSEGCVDVSNGVSDALSSAVEPHCGGDLVFVQAKLICWCYICWWGGKY